MGVSKQQQQWWIDRRKEMKEQGNQIREEREVRAMIPYIMEQGHSKERAKKIAEAAVKARKS